MNKYYTTHANAHKCLMVALDQSKVTARPESMQVVKRHFIHASWLNTFKVKAMLNVQKWK